MSGWPRTLLDWDILFCCRFHGGGLCSRQRRTIPWRRQGGTAVLVAPRHQRGMRGQKLGQSVGIVVVDGPPGLARDDLDAPARTPRDFGDEVAPAGKPVLARDDELGVA
ncbi:MAG: hypothetical protein ACRD2N_04790 [Vicinamibacterales bacterium]